MRRTAVPLLPALSALLSAVLTAPPAAAAPGRTPHAPDRPVIFVHGRNAGPGVWDSMIRRLTAAGRPADRLFSWDYDTSQSANETLAPQLRTYVDQVLRQTGAAQVDIVAHSLGSLTTRWYVKFGEGVTKVRHWVSLAGPNHGTQLAWLCAPYDQGCRDMTPGSYVVTHLNEGGETPGPVRYTTLWSRCDEQISPPTSTALAGADNIETPCLKHNDLLTDPTVADEVRTALDSA
ncbi:esterase/lipase family protein [Streptomyces sp. GS7]|uniref:esterase/lipase family protein n=1 Tax=Streptomyces sp. GS7 TaxID=2692234 RepID=UPI001317AF16|nr:triacylglycerol lipase [Streptomyces sp. GS7]QHC23139.1 triacylglycerol lipase [Streptomyces sp. GS7]